MTNSNYSPEPPINPGEEAFHEPDFMPWSETVERLLPKRIVFTYGTGLTRGFTCERLGRLWAVVLHHCLVDPDGICRVSKAQLARQAKTSSGDIVQAMGILVKWGFLREVKEAGTNSPAWYTMTNKIALRKLGWVGHREPVVDEHTT